MSIVPIDFQDGVNDLDVGINGSIYIYFFCMASDACECPEVLPNAKIVIKYDLYANVRLFALINLSSHYWAPFHANDCVLSRLNEQQKNNSQDKRSNDFFKICVCHKI